MSVVLRWVGGEYLDRGGVEQVVDGDWFIAVRAGPTDAGAAGEDAAVGAALLAVERLLAVGALVDGVAASGYGAHLAHDVAVSEAAQSRLTGIVGSRDDLPDIYGRVERGTARPFRRLRPTVSWQECVAGATTSFTELSNELVYISALVHKVTGYEPLVVDLSNEDAFSVVKVVVPGMVMDPDRIDPKGEWSVYAHAVAWQDKMIDRS